MEMMLRRGHGQDAFDGADQKMLRQMG